MSDQELAWEEIRTEHIVRDEWIDFRRSTYRFPDGREFSPYYTYTRRDYAVIVASDPEGRYLCVRQYRPGIHAVTTEFPAGGIEQTDGARHGSEQAALDCAKRELMEETGYVSDEWEHLLTVPSCATVSDNLAYVFEARNCRKAGEQQPDDTEYLLAERLTAEEIESRIRGGEFQQSVHIMAWLLSGRNRKPAHALPRESRRGGPASDGQEG